MTAIRDVPFSALPTITPDQAHEVGMQAAAWLALHLPAPPPPVAGWPEVYSLTAEPEIHRQMMDTQAWARASTQPGTEPDHAAMHYYDALASQWTASQNGGTDLPYVSPARLERAEKYRTAALERWSSSLSGPPAATDTAPEEGRKP